MPLAVICGMGPPGGSDLPGRINRFVGSGKDIRPCRASPASGGNELPSIVLAGAPAVFTAFVDDVGAADDQVIDRPIRFTSLSR
jgi:hypothetical protein